MTVSQSLKYVVKAITPPILVDCARKLFRTSAPVATPHYQGVSTEHNMRWLREGRYAEIYDHYRQLNPFNSPNESRLRQYCACMFADFAKVLPGDFLSAGISFGVAPHVIYDYVGFETLGKNYHFVDPFTGVNYPGSGTNPYNTDFDFVRSQYPPAAPIRFHRELLPDCFPLDGLEDGLAFVHLNTTHPAAEAASLAYLYERLTPGGFIVIDCYSFGHGQFRDYDPAIEAIGASVFSLVTGQGVIQKPHQTEPHRSAGINGVESVLLANTSEIQNDCE